MAADTEKLLSALLVLALDQLIEIKTHLRRPKDKIVEAELRAIRERSRTPSLF